MKLLNEISEYLISYHCVSKRIWRVTGVVVFVLCLIAMYFVLSAGRTLDYYNSMLIFLGIMDNVKSVAGLGFIFTIIAELIFKDKN